MMSAIASRPTARRIHAKGVRLSLFDLHRLLSDLGWQWLLDRPQARHPLIRNRHGIIFEITKAAVGSRKALLIDRYIPPQTFKDT